MAAEPTFGFRGKQCQAAVPDPPWYLHEYRCSRRAKVRMGSLDLCHQHATMFDQRRLKVWKGDSR